MPTMREYFFRRFGAGQPEVVKERERIYLLGMPNSSGEVFPPRINMEDKLDSLEAERDYLLDMCPKDKVDTYDPGKETTLVRILQSTLPKEYDSAQKTVMDMMRFRKASESGGMESITNLEDNVRKNYSIDWLPDYIELRTELINTWQLAERRRKEEGRRSKPGHPVLPILQGHDQPGPEQRPCYGCGQRGDHLRGDPKCPAGPDAIWDGAPAIWKERIQGRVGKGKRGHSSKGKGRGKGKGKPARILGKRNERDPASKEPCPNWNRGNGFCKYGPNCRLSHDGPKGGNKKKKTEVVFLATKKGKKARQKLASLVASDIKDSMSTTLTSENDKDEDDRLYQLIRGVPTVMILRGEDGDTKDFIPINPKSNSEDYSMRPTTEKEWDDLINESNEEDAAFWTDVRNFKENEISSTSDDERDSEDGGTHFTVTLMITDLQLSDDSSDDSPPITDYVPVRAPALDKTLTDESSSESSSDSTERFVHSESKIEEARKMKFKYSENKSDQLKQPDNKMSKTFENDVTRNSKKDLLVSRITDSIYPLDDPKSLPEPQGNRKWSGLLSESQENREIFLEDRLLDWKFRAESAEENVKILLKMREEDTRVMNEKLDRVHKKIQSIGKVRDMALVEETVDNPVNRTTLSQSRRKKAVP
jgi:hypothetical protein